MINPFSILRFQSENPENVLHTPTIVFQQISPGAITLLLTNIQ